jgi:hypothetical protein
MLCNFLSEFIIIIQQGGLINVVSILVEIHSFCELCVNEDEEDGEEEDGEEVEGEEAAARAFPVVHSEHSLKKLIH